MLVFTWILLAIGANAAPIISEYCTGRAVPLPLHERQHQGLILASDPRELGSSFEDWEHEMTEVSWKVAFFDDGYMDDGQTFRFITTFPTSPSESDLGVHNIDLAGLAEERDAWLDVLRNSKALIIYQMEGNERYIADAHCAGVTIIHLSHLEADIVPPKQSTQQAPLTIETQLGKIVTVPRGNIDRLVSVIDQVANPTLI